ncbi:MAG: hypothetical protein MJ001_03100 [Paludibacteraceae bacterium]|nr:hypothetical protein [Paludibacteraceae bacterium]
MTKKVTVYEEEENSNAVEIFLLTIVATVIGIIASIFAAFIIVGVLWGTFKSLYNYVNAVVQSRGEVGRTITYAWNDNVIDMQYFFNRANYYDGILKILVRTFLVMAGVGIIFVGTILLPVYIVLHLVIWIIILPFHLMFSNI